jgi:peptide-methionine (R)-S-oxide reductase
MVRQQNKDLSDEQKDILFNHATEAPFSGSLLHNEEDGSYHCANCDNVVFGSETKFDSGSGWPSFYDVRTLSAVHLKEDRSLGMQRVEVTCGSCGAHLGHVFNDAIDQPTGMRFCINSLALQFKPNPAAGPTTTEQNKS